MDSNEIKTINCTFKIKAGLSNDFENFLKDKEASHLESLISYEVLPNTEHLNEDKHFKELIKKAKNAKTAKYNYINKHGK